MKRQIVNPIFRDSCTFLRTAAETNGRLSDMIVELGGQVKNPVHRHTQFAETFIALEGDLGLRIGGRTIILKPGDNLTVQKGEPHCFFNPIMQPIKFHVQFTPGHVGAENMRRIIYGLAADGETDAQGVPRDMGTIALLADMGDTQLTGIYSLLNPMMKRLARKARRSGLEKRLVEKYCN